MDSTPGSGDAIEIQQTLMSIAGESFPVEDLAAVAAELTGKPVDQQSAILNQLIENLEIRKIAYPNEDKPAIENAANSFALDVASVINTGSVANAEDSEVMELQVLLEAAV